MESLVIQTAFLGDLVLSIPLIRQLTQIDPDHHVTVVCRKGLGEVIRYAGVADEVIEVDKKDKTAWSKQRSELMDRTFRHVVCPHESPRTAALVWKLKSHGRKVGFHLPWNFFAFDDRVVKPMHLPDALRQLALLTPLSSTFAEQYSEVAAHQDLVNCERKDGPIDFRKSHLPVWAALNPNGVAAKRESIENHILIAPGSVWNTKRWTLEGYIEVAKRLVNDGYNVTVIGSKEERELGNQVVAQVTKVKNQAGVWSIRETLEAMKTARAIVANDSGAIHLAAMQNLPTVAVFGPTVLAQGFRPWQRDAIVVQKDLSCRPCGRHGHKECPIQTHACMKEVPSHQVLAALRNFVS